jgi:hypothetical protein
MDGPAPAILNAVENALCVSFDRIPLLPEDVIWGLLQFSREPTTADSAEQVGSLV